MTIFGLWPIVAALVLYFAVGHIRTDYDFVYGPLLSLSTLALLLWLGKCVTIWETNATCENSIESLNEKQP